MTFVKKQRFCIASIFIGLAAIVFFLLQFNHRVLAYEKAEIQEFLEEIQRNSAFTLRSELKQFVQIIESEARAFSLAGPLTDAEIMSELKSFPKDESMLRTHILTQEGKFYSSINLETRQYNPTEYADRLASQEIGIAPPRRSDTFNKMVVEIAVPLYINGEHIGVLVGCYDLEFFENLLANNFLSGDCSIYVASADGTLIAQSTRTRAPMSFEQSIFDHYRQNKVSFQTSSVEQLQQDMQAGRSGFSACNDQDGNNLYFSYAPVGVNDWYIASLATDRTIEDKTETINRFALWLVAGVSLAVLFISVVIVITSAQEHKRIQALLQKIANTDSLTKLDNRYAIEHKITDFLAAEGLSGNHVLMMIDIDGFKHVNDHLGHIRGDEILAEMGIALRAIFPKRAIVGRIGGDEFIALLPNFEHEQEITSIAQSICETFCKSYTSPYNSGHTATTTASIGISRYGQDGYGFHDLYHCADAALYRSKGLGQNRYSFYEKGQEASIITP